MHFATSAGDGGFTIVLANELCRFHAGCFLLIDACIDRRRSSFDEAVVGLESSIVQHTMDAGCHVTRAITIISRVDSN